MISSIIFFARYSLSNMLREPFAVVNLHVTLDTVEHVTVETLKLANFITTITLFRPSLVIIFKNLKELRIGRAEFFINRFTANTEG